MMPTAPAQNEPDQPGLTVVTVDKDAVSKLLKNLAHEMRDIDSSAAGHLNSLANVIETDTNAHAWADVDLYHVIRPETIAERYRQQNEKKSPLLDILETIRNGLIFAPIVFTWYSISSATSQYQKAVDALPNNSTQSAPPFLYLWQQGFHHGALRLSDVAIIDAILLVIIFFLTLLIPFFLNRSMRQRDEEAQQLYAKVTHVLAEASLYLLENRVTAGDNLEKAARQIDTMTKTTLAGFQQLTNDFKTAMMIITGQFDARHREAIARFDATTQKIIDQFGGISKQMTQQLEEGTRYIGELRSFVTVVRQLAQEVQTSAGGLQSASGSLSANVEALRIDIEKLIITNTALSAQQDALYQSFKPAAEDMRTAATQLTEIKGQQNEWNDKLKSTLSTLATQVEQAGALTITTTQLAEHQRAFLQALSKEGDAQQELVQKMVAALDEMRKVLTAMQAGEDEVRNMSIDMQEILRIQTPLTKMIKTDFATIIESLLGAAQAIQDSANALTNSATVGERANYEHIRTLPMPLSPDAPPKSIADLQTVPAATRQRRPEAPMPLSPDTPRPEASMPPAEKQPPTDEASEEITQARDGLENEPTGKLTLTPASGPESLSSDLPEFSTTIPAETELEEFK